jgi:hypothetical protein
VSFSIPRRRRKSKVLVVLGIAWQAFQILCMLASIAGYVYLITLVCEALEKYVGR